MYRFWPTPNLAVEEVALVSCCPAQEDPTSTYTLPLLANLAKPLLLPPPAKEFTHPRGDNRDTHVRRRIGQRGAAPVWPTLHPTPDEKHNP